MVYTSHLNLNIKEWCKGSANGSKNVVEKLAGI